jgi:colicin import membrane protein
MAEERASATISLRERSFPLVGPEDRLPKWVIISLTAHAVLIASMFLMRLLPNSERPPLTYYTVDLVGGEKIGRANLGTELTPAVEKPAPAKAAPEPKPIVEPKKEKEKVEKIPPVEKQTTKQKVVDESLALKEKKSKVTAKPEPAKDNASEAAKETASAESVRERLIQSAAERARNRNETSQKSSKTEQLSSGNGEGEGAAAKGQGGRGGPGVVKGIDFIVYQNRMLETIKDNWSWVGQRSNLKVVVHFGIKDTGEIVGLKVAQPSGDASYDESVLRAVKKSSPLPAPPESYRKDFADVELTFRPRDLGA